jgi:hypothetical protein
MNDGASYKSKARGIARNADDNLSFFGIALTVH